MINLKPILLTSVILLLNACGGSSGTPPVVTLSIIAQSGFDIVFDGAYGSNCYSTGVGTSSKDNLVVTDDTFNFTQTDFSDDACSSGSVVLVSTLSGTCTTGVNSLTSGWTDGAGDNTAPLAANGFGTLAVNAPYTPISCVISTGTGLFNGGPSPFNLFYVVDDTLSPALSMYHSDDFHGGSEEAYSLAPLFNN